MKPTPEKLAITACPHCSQPTITTLHYGRTIRCDPQPLTPTAHAHAITTATATYQIRTLGPRQWLQWHNPRAPRLHHQLAHLITTSTPHSHTNLKEHTCPPSQGSTGATTPNASSAESSRQRTGRMLSQWAREDRAAISPESPASTSKYSPDATAWPF